MSTAENEKIIVCQMLLDNSIIPQLKLKDKHFTDERYKRAFKMIVAAYDKYGGATRENLTGFSSDFVFDITQAVPFSANYEFFQNQIISAHNGFFQDQLLQRCMMLRKEGKERVRVPSSFMVCLCS